MNSHGCYAPTPPAGKKTKGFYCNYKHQGNFKDLFSGFVTVARTVY